MNNQYLSLQYNSKNRWLSYWYQISETLSESPEQILVIGKGSGVTEHTLELLSNNSVNVVTVDLDKTVNPSVAADVIYLPFKDNAFDVVICCQVLEHLPFDHFSAILGEIHRVSAKKTVLSLPHARKHIKIHYIFFKYERLFIYKNPFTKKNCTSKTHCWEIGRSVSLKQVRKNIKQFFYIEREYLNELSCNHRFFILRKRPLQIDETRDH